MQAQDLHLIPLGKYARRFSPIFWQMLQLTQRSALRCGSSGDLLSAQAQHQFWLVHYFWRCLCCSLGVVHIPLLYQINLRKFLIELSRL